MKSHSHARDVSKCLLIVFCLGLPFCFALAQDVPVGKLPAMITSSGQSPDAFMVKVLCDRNKMKLSYNSLLKPEALKEFKTVMVVMGGSAKGLGEAGIDEKEELQRVKNVIAKAKEQKAMVIGMHVGGEARRGPLSIKFIEVAAPFSDYLIVTEDGNLDGYFTKLSKEKKIPLTVINETTELGALLKKVFQMK
jgi:hypothetical protein